MRKLLLSGVILLSLSACNKEPTDIGVVPKDYDLNAAIGSLPQEKETEAEMNISVANQSKIPTAKEIELLKEELIAASERNDLEKVKELLADAESKINTYDDTTTLIWASKEGHTQLVKALLAASVKVDYCLDSDDDGTTALRWAAARGHTDIVKLLLAAGADVNNAGAYTGSALAGAARNGHTEIVKLLLAAGADVNQVAEVEGDSALMQAAAQGCTESVKLLLAAGADVNATDEEGRSALIQAARPYGPGPDYVGCQDKNGVAKELIAAGANVNIKTKEGQTPLFYATYTGNTEMVKWLLENGADVNARFDGETPLQRAQEEEFTEIIELLKAYGAREDSINSRLFDAVKENNQPLVKELLEKGANPNVPYYEIFPPADTDDETPLFVASKQGYVEIMKMLIQAGARVNTSCCVLGYTPLIFAVQNEQVAAVKVLIDAGADINMKGGGDCDSLGETPLIYAIKIGNIEIVQLLLQAEADVNATYDESCGSRKNITALMEAQKAGNTKIVELLKQAGAKE